MHFNLEIVFLNLTYIHKYNGRDSIAAAVQVIVQEALVVVAITIIT